jgi:hypothetical protein
VLLFPQQSPYQLNKNKKKKHYENVFIKNRCF